MDPSFFPSNNPNEVPQEISIPSMAIPEDPFISPLYEAMFPFGAAPPATSTTFAPYNLSFDPITADPPMFSIGDQSHDLSYPQLFPTTDYAETPQPGYFMTLLNSDLSDPPPFSLHCPSQSSSYQLSSEEVAPDHHHHHQAFDDNNKVTEGNPKNTNHKKTSAPYTYSKYKYACEPCRVYFSTPQALGGHMSYHSKERKGMPIAPIRRSSTSVYDSGKSSNDQNPTQPNKGNNDDDKGKDILIDVDITDIDNVSSAATGGIDLDFVPWGTQVEFNDLMEEGEKEAMPNYEDLQLIMDDVDVSAMIDEMFVDFDCTFDTTR